MANRLAQETSPYLLQHADNPVDWWPWCEQALELARREERPILLSIGYSACHWCHVMAHESFEDEATAAVMNRLFVNIKVDREERPDLDHIYQLAHQMLAERAGGWPLTLFLAPDGTPFFGGTYFPPEPRYGLPGFRTLLERVAEAWHARRSAVEEQNRTLRAALARHAEAGVGASRLSGGEATLVRDALLKRFDPEHGGFGPAPKFPHVAELDFLLRRSASHDDREAREACLHTLSCMAEGGLFDQIGGGFFRYSTDAQWQIPHFEKMLYDNGPLLALYADACRVDPRPLFVDVLERTAGWMMREMQLPDGGYCASLDADSEGEEGRFYVWDPELLRAALPPDQARLASAHYGVDTAPNFDGGHWHLRVVRRLDEVARASGVGLDEAAARLAAARKRLFQVREERPRPARDDKVLAAWNGLAIAGMARAGQTRGRPDWIASARRAADFVRTRMWDGERLLACHTDGRARFNGYLDDYAFMLDGLLALAQAELRGADLGFACELADALLQRFEDREQGGFLFTSHDHEQLICRPRECRDHAMPAGNSIAARALLRLGHLAGEPRYLRAAERAIDSASADFSRQPDGFASLMVAVEELQVPPLTVLVCGPAAALVGWRTRLAGIYLPHALTVFVPDGSADLPDWLQRPRQGHVNAWVCSGVNCLPPTSNADELVRELGKMVKLSGIG